MGGRLFSGSFCAAMVLGVALSSAVGAEVMSASVVPGSSLVIKLSPLSASETTRLAKQHASPDRFLVGFGRPIPGLAEPDALAARLSWQDTGDGGKAASVTVTSRGALSVRLGVQVMQLPDAAALRFITPRVP